MATWGCLKKRVNIYLEAEPEGTKSCILFNVQQGATLLATKETESLEEVILLGVDIDVDIGSLPLSFRFLL